MLNKEMVKDIIADNQRFATSIAVQQRGCGFENALNYVLVGLRRTGKSYTLYQRIQQMIAAGHSPEEILYFNFEDDRLGNVVLSDLDTIKVAYEEMYGHRPIFFLDEIQVVAGWEKFARRIADQKYCAYITGSNAKMLSAEIATTLGGRYMIKEIFPYSFGEYLEAAGLDLSKRNAVHNHRMEIQRHFETYFKFGGLPEMQGVQDKRRWLSELFNKIFFGDLIARHSIRNDHALKLLSKKLAESVKQATSYTRLANIVSSAGKKVSTDTIIDYVQYMCESWLLLPIENIAGKLTERCTKRKYYFVDNGLLNLFLFDPNTSLLENLVAITLYKRYGDELHFYQNGVEIDFYIPSTKTAIQVAYTVQDPETLRRETMAMVKAAKHIDIEHRLIITRDEADSLEVQGHSVKVLPVWKWLLGKE